MAKSRGVLLASITTLAALATVPAPAERTHMYSGPVRYITGSMAKAGVTVSFLGEIFDGLEAGTISGQPYGGPLVEAVWGSVTVRKGTVSKTRAGWWFFAVTIDPVLGTARMSGANGGVSIDVTLTANGDPAPVTVTPDPGSINPPSFVELETFLAITRPTLVTGRASATGVGEITGGTGSGRIAGATEVYAFYRS